MTTRASIRAVPAVETITRATWLLPVFIISVFTSAALLFAVEPMFTKMVLPHLGGSASVWSIAMVFFQTILLAAYAYAHFLTRFTAGLRTVAIHVSVMLVALVALPLHIANGWGRPPQSHEEFWLMGLFIASIGLPFFALAANGPLLQAWLVRTQHPAAANPYFLYAASNAGSFLALLSYPTAIEPFIKLSDQSRLWTVGFVVLTLLVGACGMLHMRWQDQSPAAANDSLTKEPPATWRDTALWVALSAVPSGLLLAVTTHISTDVAAVPLFWVLPLALYLLSLIIAFQSRPLIPHRIVVTLFPGAVITLAAFMVLAPPAWIVTLILIHSGVFFLTALMCHGELARRRPAPRYLTGFYMWVSVGGMAGGVATGLAAPHVFSWVAEYPLLVVLAILCLPRVAGPGNKTWHGLAVLICGLSALVLQVLNLAGATIDTIVISVLGGMTLAMSVYFWQAPLPLAAMLAFFFFLHYANFGHYKQNFSVRNFFGVLTAAETQDGRFRILWHGTIGQGAQRVRDDQGRLLSGRPEMISEFFDGAGLAQTVEAVRARVGGPIRYAVVGLGTGAMSCRANPEDSVTYFEIDPDVIRVARDPSLFSFISECHPDTQIVQGDARLTLRDMPDHSYDMILIDAFLGAAIPTHLLTREAMELYLRKLTPDGFLAVHVSNRNLELASVVAGIAGANGAVTRLYQGGDVKDDPHRFHWVPKVAIVARKQENFGMLGRSAYWPMIYPEPGQMVWSDDYSNVTGALLRKLRK